MTKKLLFLILLGILCLGMATPGGLMPGAPVTDRLFRATVIDQSDNSYQVQNISVEGATHLPARTGNARASVDFGKISTVRFYQQDEEVLVRVIFIDNQERDFYIQPETVFLGQTDWGGLSFQARDIKEISFKR